MTYTAEFRQPTLHLNPANLRMSAIVKVEIFQVGVRPPRWQARTVGTEGAPGGRVLEWETHAKIEAPSPGLIQQQVARLFEQQVSEWQEHASPEEIRERETPALSKKKVSTPRDNYGV